MVVTLVMHAGADSPPATVGRCRAFGVGRRPRIEDDGKTRCGAKPALGFLVVGVVGATLIVAENIWITDVPLFQASFFITGTVVVLSLSMVAHIWLFCCMSGRPMGNVWRPALVLHCAIVLPAPFLFIAATIMASTCNVALGGRIFLVWGGITLILIFLEARLLGSRQFSFIFGIRSLEKRLGMAVLSGGFAWMLGFVLFLAILSGSEI